MFKNRLHTVRFAFTALAVAILFASFFSLPFTYNTAFAQEPITTEVTEVDNGEAGLTGAGKALNLTEWNLTIFNLTSGIGFAIMWFGGILLDISLGVFTVNMSAVANFFGLTNSIAVLWGVVRDLFNLLFIFGLIYAGFKIILGIDESGTRRMISSIIFAALIINFSLYIVQITVDFTNVLSFQISQMITVNQTSEIFGISYQNISDGFTTLSGISATTDGDGLEAVNNEAIFADLDNPVTALVLGILFMIFYTLLGFAFAGGAFMLFSRFLILLVLMITSPLMFIGRVFPFFKSLGDMWTKTFVGQAMVGPVYLFMLYLTSVTLGEMGRVASSGAGIFGIVFSLLIVAGLLFASLFITKKVGGSFTTQAMNFSKGLHGVVARNTVGRLADRWDRNLEKRGVSDKSWRRLITGNLAKSKFSTNYSAADARSSQEKADQNRARHIQVYGGKPNLKLGNIGRREKVTGANDTLKAGVAAPKSTDGDEARIAMERSIAAASNEQILDLLGEHQKGSPEYDALVSSMTHAQFDAAMKAKPEDLDDNAKASLGEKRAQSIKAKLPNFAAASEPQLKVLGAKEIINHAGELKQSQFDYIMKSKDFTETEQGNIKQARENSLKEMFAKKPESVFMELNGKRKKGKDVAKLPPEILTSTNAIPHLTSDDLKSIVDEQSLSPNDRQVVASNILNGVMSTNSKGETVSLQGNQSAIEFLKNNPRGRDFAKV